MGSVSKCAGRENYVLFDVWFKWAIVFIGRVAYLPSGFYTPNYR